MHSCSLFSFLPSLSLPFSFFSILIFSSVVSLSLFDSPPFSFFLTSPLLPSLIYSCCSLFFPPSPFPFSLIFSCFSFFSPAFFFHSSSLSSHLPFLQCVGVGMLLILQMLSDAYIQLLRYFMSADWCQVMCFYIVCFEARPISSLTWGGQLSNDCLLTASRYVFCLTSSLSDCINCWHMFVLVFCEFCCLVTGLSDRNSIQPEKSCFLDLFLEIKHM